MRYSGESCWQQPYQRPDGGGEQEFGYGTGDGTVTGDIVEGTLTWVNFPARREDGVWTPNLRGMIKLSGGGELLLSFAGLSIDGAYPQPRRAIVGQVGLITEHERLRWLNTCFLVGEGEINASVALEWWLDAYVCVNDLVDYQPAIGSPAPARFRQGTTTAP